MGGIVNAMFFSPTHSSRTITQSIAQNLARALKKTHKETNLTLPEARNKACVFGSKDVLVLGFPVYGGRVPEVLEKTLGMLSGSGTPAVIAAVYGNRDYDDALLEASDILTEKGFTVLAAGAFIGEHSFSRKLGANRPDEQDMAVVTEFVKQIAQKIVSGSVQAVTVKGERPYKQRGSALLDAVQTNANCCDCLTCAKNCPMGSIGIDNPRTVRAGCIHCCACVKFCPVGAKYFDSEIIAQFTTKLEQHFMARQEPSLFM